MHAWEKDQIRRDEMRSRLEGTPYFVTSRHSGTEDGSLWYVMRELEDGRYVEVEDAGGWAYEEGALMNALCIAGKLTDADCEEGEPCDCGGVLSAEGFYVTHAVGSHPHCSAL